MAKTGKQTHGETVPGIRERVRWLLLNYWNTNRSAMARDLGCSHTAIYKIVHLGWEPGPRILAALKAHPRLNPTWILTGEGEPLVPEKSTGHKVLPIAEQLLPGLPVDHADLLTPGYFPVAEPHYRPTRYWYRVGRGAAILESHEPVVAGDLLLMETSPDYRAREQEVDDRLCAIRTHEDKTDTVMLGRVQYHNTEEEQLLVADVFAPPRKRTGTFHRTPGHTKVISLGDVVAVCVLLIRQ
jgi:hypothetical protein